MDRHLNQRLMPLRARGLAKAAVGESVADLRSHVVYDFPRRHSAEQASRQHGLLGHGSIPCALITRSASGSRRNWSNSRAVSGILAFTLTAPVNVM